MSDFQPSCPNCFHADHQPVELTDDREYIALRRPSRDVFERYGIPRFECRPYHGEELWHCNQCGLLFEQAEAIELRELEPSEPPRPFLLT